MIKLTFAVCAVALLAACGGGTNVPTNAAQGIWVGTTGPLKSSGVILENGETWAGFTLGPDIFVFSTGTTTVTGNNISQQSRTLSPVGPTQTLTQTGSFVAKSTLTLTGPNNQPTAANYQTSYDTAANLTAISGNWVFNGTYSTNPSVDVPTLTPTNVSIGTTGFFNLTQEGCNIAGILSPRVGGKNVFNLGLITSGSGCLPSRNIMSGIAFIDTSVTPNEFKLITATPSKLDGLFLIGVRIPAPI